MADLARRVVWPWYLSAMKTIPSETWSERVAQRPTLVAARFAAAFVLLIAVAVAASSQQQQSIPSQFSIGFDTIKEGTLRADLTFLASDALQGRMSLQTGDEVAIQWIASEFAKAGLKPANGDSYLQAVPLVEYRGDRARTYIALKRGSGPEKQWKFPDATGTYRADIDTTAPVVFAGYGITAPELHYDDYRGIDVHGKIVLLFDHEPQETDPNSIFNGTGNTRYATTRVKVLNAQAHGAVGVLIVSEPNRKHPSNQERMARIGGSVTRAAPIPAQAIAEDELHTPSAIISDVIATELFAGAGATPSTAVQHRSRSEAAIAPAARRASHHAFPQQLHERSRQLQRYRPARGQRPNARRRNDPDHRASRPRRHERRRNLARRRRQRLRHSRSRRSRTRVCRQRSRQQRREAETLHSVRCFCFRRTRPARRFLHGGMHPLRPLATTRAMINFDMIGRNETESDQTKGLIEIPADATNRLNLIGALYSPDYNRTVVGENKYVGLDLDDRFDYEAALNVFFRSDQFPFVLHNIPAFWWFTGFHPDYHHTTDTAEKINYVKMAKILRLAYLSGYAFADDSTPPKFIESPGAPGAKAGN